VDFAVVRKVAFAPAYSELAGSDYVSVEIGIGVVGRGFVDKHEVAVSFLYPPVGLEREKYRVSARRRRLTGKAFRTGNVFVRVSVGYGTELFDIGYRALFVEPDNSVVDKFAEDIFACGGVAVLPDDVIVADGDGAVLIPAALIDAVLELAPEQERFEGWIWDEVGKGAALPGLYPPSAENKARYEASKGKSHA